MLYSIFNEYIQISTMYKSLYPSIMCEFNIAPNTQIGRVMIPEQVYDHENTYGIEEEKYSRGGEFIENLVTDNEIEYCKRWFHLAGIEEFLSDIDEFYAGRGLGNFSNLVGAGFVEPVFEPVTSEIVTPISFTNTKTESPIIFYDKPECLDYNKMIMEAKNV